MPLQLHVLLTLTVVFNVALTVKSEAIEKSIHNYTSYRSRCATGQSSPSPSPFLSPIPTALSLAPNVSSHLTGTSGLTSTPSSTSRADIYHAYRGDGSNRAGWPVMDQWASLGYLLDQNRGNMESSCTTWGVPNNSPREQSLLEDAVRFVAAATSVDARFILALILQESTGCVRVITTSYSHRNPGLMQSYNGTGTCNNNTASVDLSGGEHVGGVLDPCPRSEILQQIRDGTNGTYWGPGVVQDLGNRVRDAQSYYIAARIYNGGSYDPDDLSQPCCTPSYASDIANRLMGWVNAPRTF